jgi:hypothetical protein
MWPPVTIHANCDELLPPDAELMADAPFNTSAISSKTSPRNAIMWAIAGNVAASQSAPDRDNRLARQR